MILIVVTAQVRPDKTAAYEAVSRELLATVRANEPGTLFYQIGRNREAPTTYRVVEAYADKAAQDFHLAQPYLTEIGARIGPLVTAAPTFVVFDSLLEPPRRSLATAPMTIVVASIRVHPGKTQAYEACARDFMPKVRAEEEGLLFYEVGRSRDDANAYTAVEVYKDEAAMKIHSNSAHLRGAMPTLMACIDGAPDIKFHDAL